MRILLMQTKGRKVDSIAQLNNNNGGFVQHIKVVASRWPEVAPKQSQALTHGEQSESPPVGWGEAGRRAGGRRALGGAQRTMVVPLGPAAQAAAAAAARDHADRVVLQGLQEAMRDLVDFVNRFDASTRTKLSHVNEKLSRLERQVDFLEAATALSVETAGGKT